MQPPDLGQGNLYKYITVLGVFVCCVSVYAIGMIVASHAYEYREVVADIFESSDQPQEVLAKFLETQVKTCGMPSSS